MTFLMRRLHPLSGVVPLVAFWVLYLWSIARARSGETSFDEGVTASSRSPLLGSVEVLVIGLPLSFYVVYGIASAWTGRSNATGHPRPRRWLPPLQRASAALALVFIGYHLWEYRLQMAFFGMEREALYGTLMGNLSSLRWGIPWVALFYLLGQFAAAFHVADALWRFFGSWGLVKTRPAQRRVLFACMVLGGVLFAVGAATVLHFATGPFTEFFSSEPPVKP